VYHDILTTKFALLRSFVLLYVYKKQSKQKASSGKLYNVQGTAPRLPVKKRRRGTPRRTVPMRPPTKPLRGICHLTLGGRLQAPEGARPSHLVAAVPHQRAVGVHRRPPPHRRRRPAACSTRKPCSNCCSRPWLKCGSQRSTGKAAIVHRRTRMAVLRRLRTFPNSCFCAQRTQRRTKPFTAVSSSHRPLQTEPKWRNCTGSCLDGQGWLSRFFKLRGQNRPQPRDPFLVQKRKETPAGTRTPNLHLRRVSRRAID